MGGVGFKPVPELQRYAQGLGRPVAVVVIAVTEPAWLPLCAAGSFGRWVKLDIDSLCDVVYCLRLLRARHLSLKLPVRKERPVVWRMVRCTWQHQLLCLRLWSLDDRLLGGMSGRCGTLDNLHAGATTEAVSAGSMLVSRSGISCGRNDDLGGDKDMAAAPWGWGGVRCSWGRDISVAFVIKFIFTEGA